ncbi:hypothetical protein Salat_2522400 [Sesamum alatum]|uniref:Uncharacterized protein n=1 Tax=Sesamum alatum TaxID=300844 RepID=A0AAE1XSV0_9LAMI|nr:hypothetical protein Salat_2522400 [Sesamum alatum]
MPRCSKASSSSDNTSPDPTMVSSEAMAIISGTSSAMTEDDIRKVVAQIAWGSPCPVFNVLRIPPIQLLPNSYRLVVGFLLCAQLYGLEPSIENFLSVLAPKLTTRGSLLNAMPPLNLGEIKRRMKQVGLVNYEFKVKPLRKRSYLLWLDSIQLRIPKRVPWIVSLDSPCSQVRVRGHSFDPFRLAPRDRSLFHHSSTFSILLRDVSLGNPCDRGGDFSQRVHPLSDPFGGATPFPSPPQVEVLPYAHKRSRIDETDVEDIPRLTEETPGSSFPIPVLTPRLDLKAGTLNMSRTVHRADVDVLAPPTKQGIGNFVLAEPSTIPTAITAMVEKYATTMRNAEASRRELLESHALAQVVKKNGQIAMLSMENEVVRALIVQAYTRGREEGAPSVVAMFKDSPEYNTEVYCQASAFYIDGFATCLAQFKNVGNLPPGFELSFVNICADGFGHIGGEGPSGGWI